MDKQNITQIITDQNCTGCSACMNICPTMALAMRENDEGFIMPEVDAALCISCGKCVDICPPLHVTYVGNPNPECYAFRAADDIRFHSSSGGFFTVAAKCMFSLGGHVCGAVYDQDFNVRHALASGWEQAAPMRGSKYVQSAIDFTYKKIRVLLGNGENVLFTGTPCQVAGLNAYLGKAYDRLLTIDVVCHGVPPQRLFKQHLSEIAKGRTIKSVNFRDKRHGWTAVFFHADFQDGGNYIGKAGDDAYEAAFHPNLCLRKACANCPFCDYPRQGDLTMGDFWGYDKICPDDKSRKATSMIFVNTEKGKKWLEDCTNDVQMLKEVKCDIRALPNRLQAKFDAHPQRDRFFALIKKFPFNKSVQYAKTRYFDVCIVGNYLSENFGSIMTYYALYNVVCDLGYTALMVDRPMTAPCKPVPADVLIEKNTYPNFDLSAVRNDKIHMRDINNHAQTFLVGSDQLFNAAVYKAYDGFMSLEWVLNNKKKLAYAASCGHDDVWCSDTYRAEMSYFLKQFDAISVREKSAVTVFKRVFDVETTHVLDPVFLCNMRHWERLASLSPVEDSIDPNYVSGYILDPDDTKQKIVEYVCGYLGLPYNLYTEFGRKNNFYLKVNHAKVNTQIKQMLNCNFFVTDSFHGVCFSIIFRKNFIVIANRKRGYTRFISILEDAGLMHKLIHSWAEFEEHRDILLKPIDYESVYSKLKPIIDYSYEWLKRELSLKMRKPLNDYDMTMRMILDMRARIEKVFNKRINELESRIDKNYVIYSKLMRRLANGYNRIDDLSVYLQKLNEDKFSLIILIAAKDTPANTLEPKIQELMKELGLNVNLDLQVRKSYLAALDAGKPLAEIISNEHEAVAANIEIDSCKIELVSASHDFGNKAEIKVNGNELAVNSRGLNFVILDKETMLVLDSVAFDTWLPHAPASRNN